MKTVLGLACLLLAGCATAPRAPFAPAPAREGAATVYFFQPPEMTAALRSPTISANGQVLGKVGYDAYGVAYLPPGETSFRSQWTGIPGGSRDDSASLDLTAGESYYLRVRFQAGKSRRAAPGAGVADALVFEDRPGLEQVPAAEAVPQMNGMSRVEPFGP